MFNFNKVKDIVLVLICTVCGPYVLQMCRFPVTLKHQIGFGIIGLAAIWYIILASPLAEPTEAEDKITEVFKRQGVRVKVDDEFLSPIFVAKSRGENQ